MLRSPAPRRVSIPPGNVSYGDMLNVSPFGNFLVVSWWPLRTLLWTCWEPPGLRALPWTRDWTLHFVPTSAAGPPVHCVPLPLAT